MLDAPTHLRRTAAGVRAAQVDVAVFGGGKLGATLRAVRRHDELALRTVAQFDDRAEHLGDHVAGFAQHDHVADEHALGLHHILVVQRRLAHDRAGNPRRLHHGEGGGATRAAHRHHYVEQSGVDLLRRVLVGDGPARGAGGGAELFVQVQLVYFYDDAVDFVLDTVAMLAVIADELGGSRRVGSHR